MKLIGSFFGCFTGPDAARAMVHVFSKRAPLIGSPRRGPAGGNQ